MFLTYFFITFVLCVVWLVQKILGKDYFTYPMLIYELLFFLRWMIFYLWDTLFPRLNNIYLSCLKRFMNVKFLIL